MSRRQPEKQQEQQERQAILSTPLIENERNNYHSTDTDISALSASLTNNRIFSSDSSLNELAKDNGKGLGFGKEEKGEEKITSNENLQDEGSKKVDGAPEEKRELTQSATTLQEWYYKVGKGAIIAAFVGELMYAIFSVQDGAGGIYAFLQNMFNYPAPYTGPEGDNPNSGWTKPAYFVPALVLAALDYGLNICVMDPTDNALEAARLKKGPQGELLQLPMEAVQRSFLHEVIRYSAIGIATFNFVSGSLTDIIAPHTMAKQFYLSDDGIKGLTWGVGAPLAATGIFYYYFLSYNDVVRHFNDFAKGRDSAIAKLWGISKKACFMAISKGLVTHFYRGAVFGLITQQLFGEVLGSKGSFADMMAVLAAAAGFITSITTRTLSPVLSYLEPFAVRDKNKVLLEYDRHVIDVTDRIEVWDWKNFGLSNSQKFFAVAPALFLGLIRSVPIAYLVYQCLADYVGELDIPDGAKVSIQSVGALMASLPIFVHAWKTDVEHALNVLVRRFHLNVQESVKNRVERNHKKSYQAPSADDFSYVSTVMNMGSQTIRLLIGLMAASLLNDGTLLGLEMPLDRATALLFWVGGEVAWTQFWYYQPKLGGPVKNRGKDIVNLFSWFKEKTKACVGYQPIEHSNDEGGYQPSNSNAI